MDILFLELARIIRVLLSGEAHQAIVIHIDTQRVEARHQHVYPQIVLQSVDQMRVGYVLTGEHAFFLRDAGLAVDNLDTAATARRNRFQDPKLGRVAVSLSQKRVMFFLYQIAMR